MMNESNHDLKKTNAINFMKSSSPEKIIKLADGGDHILNELKSSNSPVKLLSNFKSTLYDLGGDTAEVEFDIIDIIMKKFNNG